MLRAMKYLLAVATLLSLTFPARAQKVDFEVGAPGVVAVGEAFRIEFTVNAKPDGFTPPAFGGFDVLAGPTTSEGTSVSSSTAMSARRFRLPIPMSCKPRTRGWLPSRPHPYRSKAKPTRPSR